jgi:hypothetical protein
MNLRLTSLLYERYPKIFQEHILPVSHMPIGFACDDGWFDVIDALCELLQFDVEHNARPQIHARQVKQKMGTLRFHTSKRTEEQNGMILFAESISGRICEVCGNPGKTQVIGSDIATRCSGHLNA